MSRRAQALVYRLADYKDVKREAASIDRELSAKTMPQDAPWPGGDVDLFKSWSATGMQP
ncbi:MAG: hypothetical protein AAFX81_18755 [Pseudomonadota bacterium]